MSNSSGKMVKSEQLALKVFHIQLNGSTGTLSVAGLDQNQVTVSRSALGTQVVTLKKGMAGGRSLQAMGHMMITASRLARVIASDANTLTVQCTDLAGADADADLQLSIVGDAARLPQ